MLTTLALSHLELPTGSNDSNVWPALLVGPAAGNGINVSVLVEGNTTTFVDLGFLVFGDVDINDTLFYIDRPLSDANATFELTDVSLLDPRLSGLGMAGSGFQGFKILLSFLPLGARKRSYIRTRQSLLTST